MTVLRVVLRIHKWIALVVGLQIAIWIAGGLVMSALPIERVRGEHKIAAPRSVVSDPADLVALADAAEAASLGVVTEAHLVAWLDRPVWRLLDGDGGVHVVDARTAAVLSPIDEADVRAAAEADYAGAGPLSRVARLEVAPSELGGEGPIWRAEFADADRTTLYIDPATGDVLARRSATWRVYDFFWRLHIMDYDDGADFNHPLLVIAAGLAALVAASGLTLLVIRMRRTVLTSVRSSWIEGAD